MRYYEIYKPGQDPKAPGIATNVRRLKGLPDGTIIRAIITDRDGSAIEVYDVPVVGGRAQIAGRGKRRPAIHYG